MCFNGLVFFFFLKGKNTKKAFDIFVIILTQQQINNELEVIQNCFLGFID